MWGVCGSVPGAGGLADGAPGWENAGMPDRVEPFVIRVDEAALEDLRDRLRRARWPEREPVGDWSQGVPLDYLRELCAHRPRV